jgi:hypothetical protein
VIVKRHGGALRFETEVGKGTTSMIRLAIDAGGTAEALAVAKTVTARHLRGNSISSPLGYMNLRYTRQRLKDFRAQ